MELNIAFAGFRHGHIFDLWNKVERHPEIRLAGAWEEDADTRAANAAKVDFNYPAYADLLADDKVDVVAIGDYYAKRGPLAIEALKAGKHVIADKPLCVSLAELDEIEKLSAEKKLAVHCMFSMRYGQDAAALRDLVGSGRLGEIRNVYFGGQHPLNYGVRPMWYFEDGKHGGTINDIAIHGIDYLAYTMGLRKKRILAARCWNAYALEKKNFKDSAQFMLELENGAGVIADVSYAALTSQPLPTYWMFIVWGSKGMVKFKAGDPELEVYFEGAKTPLYVHSKAPAADYFTELEAELEGRPGLITTAEVLRSTRDTLEIQAAAD